MATERPQEKKTASKKEKKKPGRVRQPNKLPYEGPRDDKGRITFA